MLVDLYDRVGAWVEVAVDESVRSAADAPRALERLLGAYSRIAFEAADLVVVGENRGSLPRSEMPRLRRRDRRIADTWRAVVAPRSCSAGSSRSPS